MVVSVFIGAELLFIYFTLYRRFKKIHVTLTEDGIIYNNAKGEIVIPYEKIGPMIAILIPEIIFGIKLAKGASKESFSVPERDKQFENLIYKWAIGIYTIIYFIVLIILCLK